MPMPDPSDELPPPAQKQPGTPTPGEPLHLAPAPRAHPPSIRHPREKPAPPSEPALPPELNEALEWMRRHGKMESAPDETPDEPARPLRSLLPKEQRKFHKFDPEHPLPPPSVSDENSSSQIREAYAPGAFDGGNPPGPDHPRGISAEQLAFMRRVRGEARTPWLALGVGIFIFLLVVGAFLFGHTGLSRIFAPEPTLDSTLQRPTNNPEVSSNVSADVMRLIDRAMAAQKAKDYPTAIHLLEQAQQDAGHVYGLNYRLASLCYEANDMGRVLPLLDLSITQGEEVAACHYLRGTLSNQYEDTEHGPGDLEKATQLDPFNARYFFGWGEALRRAGKPQLALVQLIRAVDRLEEPALLPLYASKVRLAQIELGQENAFASEMAAKLQLTPPPADWLFTAAAVEMHRRDFAAAAGILARARVLVGENETAARLQDVYFASFAREKELASFFEAPAAAASPSASPPP